MTSRRVTMNHLIRQLCLLIVTLIAVAIHSAVASDLAKPDLMLANIYRQGVDVTRYLVSEKLDGVRAFWNGENLISRAGNIYHAPAWFTASFPAEKLDGELWIGRKKFELLISAVRQNRPDDNEWRKVKYMVFDLPDMNAPFHIRVKAMERIIASANIPWLRLVKQDSVTSHEALMQRLAIAVQSGAEGLMLHRKNAPYRGKRTDDLLKLKPYMDAEATVIALLPGKGKYSGALGALLVETPDGVRFKIGTGFDDKERRAPPPVGAVITYQYHGLTSKGTPRFASFLRIREPF